MTIHYLTKPNKFRCGHYPTLLTQQTTEKAKTTCITCMLGLLRDKGEHNVPWRKKHVETLRKEAAKRERIEQRRKDREEQREIERELARQKEFGLCVVTSAPNRLSNAKC